MYGKSLLKLMYGKSLLKLMYGKSLLKLMYGKSLLKSNNCIMWSDGLIKTLQETFD